VSDDLDDSRVALPARDRVVVERQPACDRDAAVARHDPARDGELRVGQWARIDWVRFATGDFGVADGTIRQFLALLGTFTCRRPPRAMASAGTLAARPMAFHGTELGSLAGLGRTLARPNQAEELRRS
jgi:hypothetical protein